MILRLVIGIIIIYLLFRLFRKRPPAPPEKMGPHGGRAAVAGEDLVEDPQCHTYVPIGNALRAEIGGKKLYFCSRTCLERYQRNQTTDGPG